MMVPAKLGSNARWAPVVASKRASPAANPCAPASEVVARATVLPSGEIA